MPLSKCAVELIHSRFRWYKSVTKPKPVRLTGKPDQPRFTIIKVAVDQQETMVLQR